MSLRRYLLLITLAFLATSVLRNDALAQTPRVIGYQGVLRNTSGPISGAHSISVRLYNANGDPVFTESHSVVLGADGLFNLQIGSANPFPPSLTFNEPYWLGISVDDGLEMSPRVQLSAAPYALNTTRLNGLDGSVVLRGRDGITVSEEGNAITVGAENLRLKLPYADSVDAAESAFTIISTGPGRAGLFAVHGPSSVDAALEGIATSQRDAGGLPYNGVTGVLGRVNAAAGGAYAAGIRGVNHSLTGDGAGVVGYQSGSGWGVYGEVHDHGIGVYGYVQAMNAVGVRGEAIANNAVGVSAVFSGPEPGTALSITNGAVAVSGTNRPGFVHVCSAANRVDSNITELNYPLLNGNANAVIIVTHQITVPAGGGRPSSHNAPIGVYYDVFRSRWQIHYENGATIPLDTKFNVWMVSQK